jgi:hypothetical protein
VFTTLSITTNTKPIVDTIGKQKRHHPKRHAPGV